MAAALRSIRGVFKVFYSPALANKLSKIVLVNTVRHINDEASPDLKGKELKLVVSSLRVDRIAASGLGMGRRKTNLKSVVGTLFVNKKSVRKSSLKVKCNDVIELVEKPSAKMEEHPGKMCLSRIHINDVGEALTKRGNIHVMVTRWKNILIDKKDFYDNYLVQK